MKKKSLLIILLLLIVSLFVGISYALWQLSHTQREHNYVSSGCFSVSSSLGTVDELEPINLVDTIPMDNTTGMTTTPFTFTLTNTCTTYTEYQINLETLETSTMPTSSLKAVINNETPKLLAYYPSVETTITGASTSNKLLTGGIRAGESLTFNLRIWVDVDSDMASTANTTYEGKVSIISVPEIKPIYGTDTIMNLVKGEPNNTFDVITKEAPDSTCTNTFGYDGTTDNNLRYVGENPCNYVYFNCSTTNPSEMNSTTCEVWRIIGLMNNVDDGTGKKETRLKIIRRDSLGDYSWDSSTGSASATTEDPVVNNGYGINQWGASTNYTTNTAYPGADLMQELNGDYLDLTLNENTTWYNGSNNQETATFDYTKKLKESAQNMIGNVVWYTGAYNDTSVGNSNVITPTSYQNERSINPSANSSYHGKYCSSGTYCNDSIERTFTWTGKVGLQYPSDMGYATSGSNSMAEYTREKCINETKINIGTYNSSTYGGCGTTSWLKNQYGWSLSPDARSSFAYYVGSVYSTGYVSDSSAYNTFASRPAVYLQSSVKITGGNGSESTPYTLSNK